MKQTVPTLAMLIATGLLIAGGRADAGTPPPRVVVLGEVDRVVESHTSVLLLPASPTGTLSTRPCPNCAPLTYSVNEQTRYLARNREVTLAEFRTLVATKAPASVNVSVERTKPLVRYVWIDADAPSSR